MTSRQTFQIPTDDPFHYYEMDFGLGPCRWLETDNSGSSTLLFLAANGFPVASYRFFLADFLSHFTVLAMDNRGVWDKNPCHKHTWPRHANDLIRFIEYQKAQGRITSPVIGLGHSLGATVTAMAASKRPDLFAKLVLIDPATVPGRLLPLLYCFSPRFLRAKARLVKGTRGRRHLWQDRDSFVRFLETKPVYKQFQPAAMRDYANAGLEPGLTGDLQLVYDREWEAINFENTSRLWRSVDRLKTPALVLRAEHSYLHPEPEFNRHRKRFSPMLEFDTLQGLGHLAIQENGPQVSHRILQWLCP